MTRQKINDLPDPGSTPESWMRFMRAVREIIQTREGWRGNVLEGGVTFRDLVDLDIIDLETTGFSYTGGTGSPGPAGPPGPPGPPGDPYVPDLTAPPTPTGLTGVSMFRGAFIEWTAPTYTQGHGNAYTKVYAAQYSGTGPLPTFGTATYAGQAGATTSMYVHNAAMGAQLHFWISFVTVDDVEGSPAGGANGVQVTIGKVGNSDLGPLIVEAANLADEAVVEAKIADAAVGMDQLANNSVSVGKLLVTGLGNVLNADPGCVDASAWTLNHVTVSANSSSPFGGSTLKCEYGTAAAAYALSRPVPIDEAKNYLARVWAQQSAGAGTCRLLVAFQDATGTNIAGGATGWPTTGTYFYWGLVNQQPPGTWTEYRIAFGPNETARIPEGAAFVRIGVLANHTITVPTSTQSFAGLRISEKASADLVVDGAILARHLSAGSIAVGTAAIQNGAIVNAMIGTAAISTAKIADLAVSAAKIGDLQVTTAKIANAAITNAKINDLDAGKITAGTIAAARIGAGTIDASKISVTSLSSITSNLGAATAGSLTLNTAGYVRAGQTAYDTGTGFWLGYSGGAYKFSIGAASGAKMTWDGTDLRLSGQVFGAMSISGVTNIGGSIAAGSNKLLGTRTASVSGGTGTIAYQWYLSWSRNTPSSLQLYLTGARTASCSVYALSAAAADETDAELVCVATDANGRTAVAACDVGVVFT